MQLAFVGYSEEAIAVVIRRTAEECTENPADVCFLLPVCLCDISLYGHTRTNDITT